MSVGRRHALPWRISLGTGHPRQCRLGFLRDHGVVVRYDLRTLRETFRYGGGANAALAGARGLWFEGDILFVCCTESGKIIQINRNNYHLEDHHLFTEPVYAFMKVQATEIVWLQSGDL